MVASCPAYPEPRTPNPESGIFQNGYAAGYADGYYRSTGRDQAGPGRSRGPVVLPGYPGDPRGYPCPRGGYGYGDLAFENGFNDGYEQGIEDGRDRDRYDPLRHRRFRSADRGYEGWYGSRDAYKIRYRDGFREGYERGYRDGQWSRDRGSRSSPWWWPW